MLLETITFYVSRLRPFRSATEKTAQGTAMFNSRYLLLTILALLPARGQTTVTLPEAWNIALENNLTLQQQQKAIHQAREEVAIQKTGYLPVFSGSATFSYQSELPRLELPIPILNRDFTAEVGVKEQYHLGLAVNQPIFTGFRIRNLVKAAREREQAQALQDSTLRRQLLLQTGLLFYQLQLNLIQQEVLQEGIRRVDYRLQQARHLFHAEQAAAFDTLEVANRKLQYQSQLHHLRNLYRVLLTQFRHVLNTEAPLDVERLAVETVDLSLKSADGYLAVALAHRPELKQLAALQQAEFYRSRSLQSAYFPQIYASASYHYARPGVNFFSDKWMTYYTFGVGLQWEIWNWNRDRLRVQQSRLEYDKLDLQSRQLLQTVRQQVIEAYEYLQTAREQILFQRQIVAQERERYRITESKYAEGQTANLEVSAAETSLLEAELLLQQNYIQWYQYKLQLDFATGVIGENQGK